MITAATPDFAFTPASLERPAFGYAPADPHAPPAVSIVTPFFNTGPLFHETARSVLRQSLQQWEWLIVNDGSTDAAALAVLDEYRTGDPRIRVVDHQRNRGLPAARNTGFALARAPYVLQLDSDDLLEPTAAEVWAWYLEAHPAAAFVKGYSVGFGAERYLWTNGFHNPDAFLRENSVDPTCMVRKRAHAQAGGYDESLRAGLEDWDFWLRCADAGLWGGTVPQFLNWYRRRQTHADRWDALRGGWARRFVRAARRRYPRLWREGMPQPTAHPPPTGPILDEPPFANRLASDRVRVLVLVSDLSAAAQPALVLVAELVAAGYELSVTATSGADDALLPAFTRLTPDVFLLPSFLPAADGPRFLRYLVISRRAQIVLTAGSASGALLAPALRAVQPGQIALDAPPREDALTCLREALAREAAQPVAVPASPEQFRQAAAAYVYLEQANERRRAATPPRHEHPALRALRHTYYWSRAHKLRWLEPMRDWIARRLRG
jgi:GT2 family glycosyltransferase